MSRPILPSALVLIGALLLHATAYGMNPARQGPNGSASCPETQLAIEADQDEATAAATNGAAVVVPPAPAPAAKPAAATRPKSGGRWHSFLPGMFK